jgi:hypothetical protein
MTKIIKIILKDKKERVRPLVLFFVVVASSVNQFD